MPTVGQPQIFNLPDNTAAYQALGQGGGQLLAALLQYYRQQGVPGLGGGGVNYTSPKGQATTISPAERVRGAPNIRLTDLMRQTASTTPGATARSSFLPFLPESGGGNIETQLKQSEITKNLAQAKSLGNSIPLYDAQGNITGYVPHNAKATPGASQASQSAEKTYEFHTKSIDQYQKPVDERLDRLSRLQDTINQTTPQADALIAPELLTVMAGGQGSGLRMNEAEIARIIGGRTNLEGLKAALNKWQRDPTKGLSVTPAQRQQVRSLVNTVQEKLMAKQEILNDARQQLLDISDPKEYRNVLFQMRKSLQRVEGIEGQGNQGGVVSGGIQEGQTATNPKTGARMIFQGGQWQPVP